MLALSYFPSFRKRPMLSRCDQAKMQGFGPGRKNGLQKEDENTGVLDNTLVFRMDTCVAEAGFPGHVGRRICSRWLMGRTGCSVMGYSAAPANPRDGPPEVSRIQTSGWSLSTEL